MKKVCQSIILSLVLGLMASAQSRVELDISTDSLLIGERLTVELSAPAKRGEAFAVFPPEDSSWAVISSAVDSNRLEKGEGLHYRLFLTRFDSGYHLLNFPPIVVGRDSLRVSAAYIYVGLPAPGENEITDIRDPMAAPFNWPLYVALPLGILLVLVLVFFLYRRWKNRPPKDIGPPPILRDPRKEALELLEKLEREEAWEQPPRTFYTSLSDVIRMYWQSTYGIQAMEMTGTELAGHLASLGTEAEDEREMHSFLLASDFAKYAEKGETRRPLREEIGLLRKWIEKYPRTEPEDEKNELPS